MVVCSGHPKLQSLPPPPLGPYNKLAETAPTVTDLEVGAPGDQVRGHPLDKLV